MAKANSAGPVLADIDAASNSAGLAVGESVENIGGNGGDDGGNRIGPATVLGGLPLIEPTGLGGNSGAATGGSDTSDGNAPKRRGRKPGSSNKAPAATAAQKGAVHLGIGKVVYSIHAMLAAITKVEELALDEKDAEVLSAGITEVSRHYNMVIDPKVMAWIALLGICGSIYGPRLFAYRLRKQTEKSGSRPGELMQPFAAPADLQESQPVQKKAEAKKEDHGNEPLSAEDMMIMGLYNADLGNGSIQ